MPTPSAYDAFLSYNSLDHVVVERVAKELGARQCKCFVDRWYLQPGRDWVEALERALSSSRSVAMFIGPHEMGRWQQRERAWALDQLAGRSDFPVIPVLLPGCKPPLGFVKQLMWIDLRNDPTDTSQLDALAAAIRGETVNRDGEPEPRAMICPYRGLLTFREEDADFFFGREVYQHRLVELVESQTIVAVIGASGSGKSSLVNAGLIPALRRKTNGPVWDMVRMVPNVDPLYSVAEAFVPLINPDLAGLALERELNAVANDLEKATPTTPLWGLVNAVLRQQPGTQRLLLFVDQWEELYANCEKQKDCKKPTRPERFVEQLLEATSRKGSPLTVVLTVRSDFYNDILRNRPLLDRIQGARLDIGPMDLAELRSAVEGPGKNVGLKFEPGLSDRILKEAGDEPGSLSLLEFALEELWKRRDHSLLTHAGYEDLGQQPDGSVQLEKTGPLSRAIAIYAEGVCKALTPDEQQLLPALFRKLVRAGAKTEEDTRRRADLSNLDATLKQLARTLADKRLLVTTRAIAVTNTADSGAAGGNDALARETVEVAHEELLRRWDRLKRWVDTDRQFLQWRSRLQPLLEEYKREPKLALLRGNQIRDARQFYPSRSDELEDPERVFIGVSLDALRNRRLRRWFIFGVVSLSMVVMGYAWDRSSRRQHTKNLVESLQGTPAGSVPFYLDQLRLAPDLAIPMIREAFESNNGKRGQSHRLHAAYGLVNLDAADSSHLTFLLDSIPGLAKDEGVNLIAALSAMKKEFGDQMQTKLKERIDSTNDGATKNRLAAVAAEVGILEPVNALCKLHADPSQRTSFIRGFSEFPGDVTEVAKLLVIETLVPDTRSALCIAVGRLGKDRKEVTQSALKHLYQTAPDGGTHSAAHWALIQQGMSEDELGQLMNDASTADEEPAWQRLADSAGLTMIKIPSNVLKMGSVTDHVGGGERSGWTGDPTESDESVPFPAIWISDREITVEQFELILPQFRDTSNYNVSQMPDLLRLPMASVSWYDAIEFCNALSVKHKLKPFYKLSESEQIERDESGHITKARIDPDKDGDGYRLPTEIEWEYACRAKSAKGYHFGEPKAFLPATLLSEYAVYFTSNTEICGNKMPNAWGLFDMHGNVWEWCWDIDGGHSRVLRGGSCRNFIPTNLRSAYRYGKAPGDKDEVVGFRIARTP